MDAGRDSVVADRRRGRGVLEFVGRPAVPRVDVRPAFLRQLVALVGAKNRREEIAEVLRFLEKMNKPALMFTMTRALGDGMSRANQPLLSAGGFVTNILAMATTAADDDAVPDAQRAPAIELLAHTTYADSAKLLLTLLN